MTHEVEPQSHFDWHMDELVAKPPYTQKNMIAALAEGRFIIEGKQSGIEDAELYADILAETKEDRPELWDALEEYQMGGVLQDELY